MGDDVDEIDMDEGGGGRSKKMLVVVILLVLLLLGGAAAAYFTGLLQPVIDMLTGGDGAQTEEVISEDSIEEAPGVPENVGFVDLPEILVNLNTGAGKQSYLKIRVSLEVADQAMLPQVEQMMPRIVDNFQVYLRELRPEDLSGSEGMFRLREELLIRVSAAAKPAKINDVLFKEMLVQ
ncbi:MULTISPECIES: flagellar basal body-associated FliL family protein [Thalassospira]|jgi:flagellar FliL protein|uniref:Flagellar protein FliL n=1 Tax=Thalassospira povalilytica TaxID=732237 RepID=A0ABX4R6K9_9PROT|nr:MULTISPECIES: flagellar basal body-associated FliL family protein [Thalassospira]MEE3047667.1 flagellar basal body-associated FliL family protein [Pseudomonadota bacterium]RCK24441.1 flagellar basal body protein FliL [Thalassospira profundimaris]KZB67716.1 flagellar basal body protein FliL [Thalassospira sp. MCCC 1A02491]MAL39917.1 flagellar basal body protein FliL [Thalassospira sp.]MBO6771777.1 flagellar basal body-associated FliL family protein [Thalassospira sp.]|tara:strand:+ start:2468 stop:3004 length:537 start_codon:yes stop_codon:yes gene_type:complete